MNSNIFTFNNSNILMIFDNENNPWFKAKDVTDILLYKNKRDAIKKHVDDDDKLNFENLIGVANRDSSNLDKQTIFINESGLYSLIMRSKKEEAKLFQKWVTKEVLPSIRKNGEYILLKQIDSLNKNVSTLEKTKESLIDDMTDIIELVKNLESTLEYNRDIVKNLTPRNENLQNMFSLIRIYYRNYYVIRCQSRYFNNAVNKITNKFPNSEGLLAMVHRNPINLYHRIKEKCKITCNGNYFTINEDYSEEELKKDINSLLASDHSSGKIE